jgi:hypothetical protein
VAERADSAFSVVELGSNTSSTAWYCPGPLPIGRQGESAAIAVTNASTVEVDGQLRVATAAGDVSSEALALPPRHQAEIALARPDRPTYASVTVLLEGSGVGVAELEQGPHGDLSAPCVDHTSTTEYFAAGSTLGAANADLALYDPSATPAVANVTLSTGDSSFAPPAYQGIPVEPGQLVVLSIGHVAPQKPAVAVDVSTDGGRIVAGELNTAVVSRAVVDSLVDGASAAASTWWFGAQLAGPSASSAYSIFNPGPQPVSAELTLFGTGGEVDLTVSVPSIGVVRIAPAPVEPPAGLRFAEVTTSGRQGVVVERETTVPHAFALAATHASTPAASALGLPPAIDAGYTVTAAVPGDIADWLLAGGESDSRTGELVTLANPGAKVITVRIRQLASQQLVALPSLESIAVAPGSVVAVDVTRLVTNHPSLALLVDSSAPVEVSGTLFGHGARKPFGLSSPAALPVN